MVQPGFDSADGHASDRGDFVEGEVVDEAQEQEGTLGFRKGGEGREETGFLLNDLRIDTRWENFGERRR